MRNRLPALAAFLAALAFHAPAHAQTNAASAAEESAAPALPVEAFAETVAEARGLERLHGLIVARNGKILVEERLRGPALDQPVNIKSASKSIVAALVGRAIAEGLLEGPDQTVASVLGDRLPENADPRLREVTIGNLLSMQSGLERTSGANYGRWVQSRDWVRFALSRPFVDEPGGRMLYSTGNTHLLSAILTKVSGRSTRDLFEEWIAEPLGIRLGAWDRDPQGIYLGGNNMALSPMALLAFGEMIRSGGKAGDTEVLPAEWIEAMWTPRTRSRYSGDGYGYGWFTEELAGHRAWYGWGYGGQMLYIVPDLALTVVMTSDQSTPAGRTGYMRELRGLMAEWIIPAVVARGSS